MDNSKNTLQSPSIRVYLVARKRIQSRIILDISGLNIETGSVPGTPDSSVSQCSGVQQRSIVSTFCADRVQLSFLFDQQYFTAVVSQRQQFHLVVLDVILIADHTLDEVIFLGFACKK